jgi:hypothetical protein
VQADRGRDLSVVTPDRRKLIAPVFAQAAAFVVVLVIGGFTHHGGSPTPAPTHSTSPSPRLTTSAPPTPAGTKTKLTVKVREEGTTGGSVAGSKVEVLGSTTLAVAASGVLNANLELTTNVPAGNYEVCVNAPTGWTSAVKNTHLFRGICTPTTVASAPQTVTFQLIPPSPRAGA